MVKGSVRGADKAPDDNQPKKTAPKCPVKEYVPGPADLLRAALIPGRYNWLSSISSPGKGWR